MLLFLSVFFLIYGGMHWYAFRKLGAAVALGRVPARFIAALMIFMTMAPVLVRVAERLGHGRIAVLLAFAGYVWMGFLFLFVVFAALGDLARLGGLLGRKMAGRPAGPSPVPAATPFWLAFPVALLLCGYGWWEAVNVRLERVVVPSAKLPAGMVPFRIVQISDVHLGVVVRKARLARILAVVAAAKPDLLVSTGDFVDGQADDIARFAGMFHAVQPRFGKYAVTGNHEYYVGLEQSLAFIRNAGFTVLQGEAAAVAPFLTVVGVDDPTGVSMGLHKPGQEEAAAAALDPGVFTLLLKHRPAWNFATAGAFDLQLSGHVHKGQIFPFNLLTWLAYPVRAGLTGQEGGLLYVSRGSGTWGPPMRLLAPPEVTLIELVPAPVSGTGQ